MPKQIQKSQRLRNNEYYDTQKLFDGLYERSLKGEFFTNLMKIISDWHTVISETMAVAIRQEWMAVR